ncbi:hypothetical protein HDU67_001992 [Dinochytrium kinnereticum]|nr:hypothetical protein HDU67_001992 [Dinochytrium kinnereticum]
MYRYFESARLAYFEQLIANHLSPEVHRGFIRGRGVGRILKSATLDLVTPAPLVQYPDTLWIGARTSWIGQDRFSQSYVAVSERLSASGTGENASDGVVARGDAVIVIFDHIEKRSILSEFSLSTLRVKIANIRMSCRKAIIPSEVLAAIQIVDKGVEFESGRIAYFDQIVGEHLAREDYDAFIKAKKVGPILKSASIKYIAPVEYPDTLTVGVRVPPESIGNDRFTQSFKAVSHKLGRVVAEGEAVIGKQTFRMPL